MNPPAATIPPITAGFGDLCLGLFVGLGVDVALVCLVLVLVLAAACETVKRRAKKWQTIGFMWRE